MGASTVQWRHGTVAATVPHGHEIGNIFVDFEREVGAVIKRKVWQITK